MSDTYIPLTQWGKDHWSTLAYVETVIVDMSSKDSGFQVGFDPRLRTNRHHYRIMTEQCPDPIRAKPTPEVFSGCMWKQEYATKLPDGTIIPNHDDWCCIQDMANEGLFDTGPNNLEPGTIINLSPLGRTLVNQLREYKGSGGQYSKFKPPPLPSFTKVNKPILFDNLTEDEDPLYEVDLT